MRSFKYLETRFPSRDYFLASNFRGKDFHLPEKNQVETKESGGKRNKGIHGMREGIGYKANDDA